MSVQAENFTIQQGETFSKDFILKNPDKSLVGISSYTSTAFLAKYAGDSTTYAFTLISVLRGGGAPLFLCYPIRTVKKTHGSQSRS